MVDWMISPLNGDLTRGPDPLSGWRSLTLVQRHNQPDTWTITGPASVLEVFDGDSGCLLDRDGVQVASGRITNIAREGTTEGGVTKETMTVAFESHLAILNDKAALPSRTFEIGTTPGKFPGPADVQTGPAETLMLYYIRANLGDLALATRQQSRLRIPATLGRGPTTTVTARLQYVGGIVQSLAETARFRVDVQHAEPGPWLDVIVEPVVDVSTDIRFGTVGSTAAGLITQWRYELSAPRATRAIVGGSGEGADRTFLQDTDRSAESGWGRVREVILDQRSTASADEMLRVAREELTKSASPVSVSFTPALGPDLQYWRDVRVGYRVGYDLPGLPPAEEIIRQATTTVQSSESGPTESTVVVVGSPDAPVSVSQRQLADAISGVRAIQRSR